MYFNESPLFYTFYRIPRQSVYNRVNRVFYTLTAVLGMYRIPRCSIGYRITYIVGNMNTF